MKILRRPMILYLALAALTLAGACKKSESPVAPSAPGSDPTATPTDPAPCPSPASFGSSATGGSSGSSPGNLVATRWQLPADARIVKLGIYLSGGGAFRLALYADDPGTQLPTTLLRQSQEIQGVIGWNEVEIGDLEATTGYFWLARQSNSISFPISSWTARQAAMNDFPYGSFPSNYPVSLTSNSGAVIPFVAYYCTFTPTPTPTLTPSETPSPTLSPTETRSETPTDTVTVTATPTGTSTFTVTPSWTPTRTPTTTDTVTPVVTLCPGAGGWVGQSSISSPSSFGDGSTFATRVDPGAGVIITSLRIYAFNSGISQVLALYDDDGTGALPVTMLSGPVTYLSNLDGWITVPCASVTLPHASAWIALSASGTPMGLGTWTVNGGAHSVEMPGRMPDPCPTPYSPDYPWDLAVLAQVTCP